MYFIHAHIVSLSVLKISIDRLGRSGDYPSHQHAWNPSDRRSLKDFVATFADQPFLGSGENDMRHEDICKRLILYLKFVRSRLPNTLGETAKATILQVLQAVKPPTASPGKSICDHSSLAPYL